MTRFNDEFQSIRANHLRIGDTYAMSTSKNKEERVIVTFNGFYDTVKEETVSPPRVLKAMPRQVVMKFTNEDGEELVVTKDPNNGGAVFFGDKRATFGATPELKEIIRRERHNITV